MTKATQLPKLTSEQLAFLEANAAKYDVERWLEGHGSAPWHSEKYGSVAAMKAAAKSAGSYFFSAGAMRFFNSKVESPMLHDGRFFVTSEYREDPAEKLFSVRWASFDPDSEPAWESNGLEFQQFATLREAKAAALVLAGICSSVLAANTNSQEG